MCVHYSLLESCWLLVSNKNLVFSYTGCLLRLESLICSTTLFPARIERFMPCPYEKLLYNCGRIFFILPFFVSYISSFGLVRLRTIRLSARVGAHIERRYSRSRGEDVAITDIIIKIPDRKFDWGCEWRHARKRWAGDSWWFLKKKQLVEI